MKVLILAGGLGSRLSEETELKPKPMVEIGGKPILWHIMKIYSYYGFNDFMILLGYKGYVIKEYFANYYLHQSDVTFNMKANEVEILNNSSEPWKVTLIDTGLHTMTGGRIKRVEKYINNETFMLTYGDGVANIDIRNLLEFHESHNKLITMTSVQPEGRFGSLVLNGSNEVVRFQEKVKGDGQWINAGFFVCEPGIIDYLNDDSTIFERDPLERLALEKQLVTFKHRDFWKPMDTLRDKKTLEDLIASGKAPWMMWDKVTATVTY
ncbi:glucose-1-phosphate cytidylyltransferase [Mariniphaga sediminis]|jgi:glucose-1-phosphate cytidylyltransferase|uniref:Glucose-1-phosphate cytidylyltransferase n=1 Tax=Mariniphaga sediminis TaxID=1628158 RepID=A0A399D2I4_9BACT|nr:glucose-1-phosphate cytidylyltransferase [Mariniphaga sediminis]RIH65686.1 glucose-1-phosphate cytidylyltransferase [Mariniphaga sediminis]